jgi:hypothetical protein
MGKTSKRVVKRTATCAIVTRLQAAIAYCARQTGNVLRVGRIAYEEPRRMTRGTIYGIGVMIEETLTPVLVRVEAFKSVMTCGHKVELAWVRHHATVLGWVPVSCLGRVGMTEVYSYMHGTQDTRIMLRALEAGVDIETVAPNVLPTDTSARANVAPTIMMEGRNECGHDGQWQEA